MSLLISAGTVEKYTPDLSADNDFGIDFILILGRIVLISFQNVEGFPLHLILIFSNCFYLLVLIKAVTPLRRTL